MGRLALPGVKKLSVQSAINLVEHRLQRAAAPRLLTRRKYANPTSTSEYLSTLMKAESGLRLLNRARLTAPNTSPTSHPTMAQYRRNRSPRDISPDLHGDRLLHHSRGRNHKRFWYGR
jgi:hypothetical protein